MKLFSYVLLAPCLLFSLRLSAQAVTVTDEDRKPQPGVLLHTVDKSRQVTTDSKGMADISIFRGSGPVIIQALGFETQQVTYEAIKAAGFKIVLRESYLSLDEVVVSASKWEQDKREVPNRIATIPRREIEFQNVQTAADLLAASGQVYVQKSQLGGGSPMIRGFSANRILVVVDGVRLNNAIYRSGNLQNVISLDPHLVDHAEVIFGPGSVAYGSDAIGGVMDFHSRKPRLSTTDRLFVSGNGVVRYSTANKEKTGHLDFTIGGRRVSVVTSITYSDYDHLRMGAAGPAEYQRREYVTRIDGKDSVLKNPDPDVQVPTGYNQINLTEKIRFRPGQAWDITYAFHYSATSDVPRYDRLIEYTEGGAPRNAEWRYGPQKWAMHTVKTVYTEETPLFHTARLILASQDYQESRHSRRFSSHSLRHQYESVNALSASMDFDKKLAPGSTLFYGTEAVLNTVGSEAVTEDIRNGNKAPAATRYPDGSTWNALAAYVNAQSNVSPEVTLLGGLRFNFVRLRAAFDTSLIAFPFTEAELKNRALNGSFGLVFRPSGPWQISTNLSTGFRAPNIDDVGKVFESEAGAVTVPNPHLSPEHAYNAEVSLAKSSGKVLKLDISAFYTLLEDAMVRRNFTFNGNDSIIFDDSLSRVQAIQNVAQAYIWGLQVGVELTLPAGFSFTSHLNYQKGEEQDEATNEYVPLRHAAPFFGSAHLLYRRDRFKMDLYTLFNSEVPHEGLTVTERAKPAIYATDVAGKPYSPAWWTLNLKASLQIIKNVALNAGVENILDVRYRPYSSGIVAPGRNFIAALRARF